MNKDKIMAVGKVSFPQMNSISGVRLVTVNAGIKQMNRDDLLLIELNEAATCAGVFTQNAFCAAPVTIARQHLSQQPHWLLINSGNANAGTGEQGFNDALQCCQTLATLVGGEKTQVLPFSTGVIGESLPIDKIIKVLPKLLTQPETDHWQAAAQAIMTTDTFPKGVSHLVEIEGQPVRLTGIAKGAGMIQPNMATMLAFIATDAKVEQGLLQQCLTTAAEQSFNLITVDGDTSTNDACMLMATGQSSATEILPDSESYTLFSEAVTKVCKQLAELIVRDGEGATKLIKIQIEQAQDWAEATQVAKTIAHSPLVKTAFFASDPNWGRILAAIGRSGIEQLDLSTIKIFLDEVCLVEQGGCAASYTEQQGQAVMNQDEITIRVVLARGTTHCEVMTCDLSYDYVRINAEYRT